jgi:hypothetical protein
MNEKKKEFKNLFPEMTEEEETNPMDRIIYSLSHERDIEEAEKAMIMKNISNYLNYKAKTYKIHSEEKKKITEQNFRYDIIEKMNNFEILLEKLISTNEALISCITDTSGDVEEVEVQEIQDLPDEVIEEIIINYLKDNPDKEVFPSDVAFAFNLDAYKVFEISERMKEEGKIV